MPAEPVLVGRVPGERGRELRWWLYLWGSFAVVPATAGWHWVRDPGTWPWGVAVTLLVGGILVTTVARQTWLDPVGHRLLHRVARVLRREVAWADARVLRLRHSLTGMVLLQVRGRGRLSIYVPVVGDDERGPRGQPPELLRLLALEIRRSAPAAHAGVADELDAQAAHLERGGGLLDSPVLTGHRGPRIFR